MLRASAARLACRATNGGVQALVPVYVGSIVKSVSGTIQKEDLLALTEKGSPSLALVECVGTGGGASGGVSYADVIVYGGNPGLVSRATVAYQDLPDTIAFTIGAGGIYSASTPAAGNGGTTLIAGILSAAGGQRSGAPLVPHDRPSGPGQGAPGAYSAAAALKVGGNSNDSDPSIRLTGTSGNGRNAVTPFQHGTGGGVNPRKGGWPGGGGGRNTGGGGSGGPGGGGSVVFHVYELRRA